MHTDSVAHDLSARLGAKAFTHGNDIYLAKGESASDTGLIAHEASHVAQQQGGRPPSDIQRRVVMRSMTPDIRRLWLLGDVQVGTTETLRPMTSEEVETYVAGIGSQHHEYDDIIAGTGKTYEFVGGESYRRDLVVSVIRNLDRVRTDLYFDDHPEFVREVRKRALISLVMRATQGRTLGTRPTGYPASCKPAGPRVSAAAAGYWIVHPAAAGRHYWFELSASGRADAYAALRTLLFNHQASTCLRTLMHCDYMIAAQQYYVMAETLGATDFNRAVLDGQVVLELRWNSFEDITADTPTSPGDFQSLQTVELTSEDDFLIGDHVVFFNHDAFDDLNEVHHNVRGDYSSWRLENAIISDVDSSGQLRFQGHGYFSPKRRAAFVADMAGRMNDLVDAARSAITAGRTIALGYSYSDGSRFEVLRRAGTAWQVHYHVGMGTEAGSPVMTMPLRHLTAADYPQPFVQPGQSRIRVRRPIESRRESLGRSSGAGGTPSPVPSSGRPLPTPAPAPSTTTPAPSTPAPAPAGSPVVPPAPAPATPGGPAPTPPAPAPLTGPGQQPAPPQEIQVPPPGPHCPYACTVPHLLGTRSVHYGRGADFESYPTPAPLSTTEWLRVAPFRWMPDSMLEFGMDNVLGALAGSTGRRMVAHFRGGSGATWIHGLGSELSTAATRASEVDDAVSQATVQLAAQMRAMRSLGTVDCRALSISPVHAIHFGYGLGDSAALKGVIGGTQGQEVYVLAMRPADPASCTYAIDLQFIIFDDFGVDTSDLYWPALIKFWILQHERPGNRPFINKLVVNRTITV